ncbi:hypothetical protein BTJ68_04854 [Hortaea werneckii EXF-2000]|uniref:Dynactin subunit 4 n=1 Tax=Hortaea werneckii EXF-2000 TaxID=1157616 RepID=A0A1Z5TEH7_HORWE|nr:hypothetical protein BTJ68_04854 [Hortaea werneckii EXF-2000]
MASSFPYTHYACPCTSLTASPPSLSTLNQAVDPTDDAEEDGRTFNPHSARPTTHYTRSINSSTATNAMASGVRSVCLFEVPSSAVRGDGNRCARNCYQCPECTASLAVTAVPHASQSDEADGGKYLKAGRGGEGGGAVSAAMSVLRLEHAGPRPRLPPPHEDDGAAGQTSEGANRQRQCQMPMRLPPSDSPHLQHEDGFQKLQAFYQEQLTESSDAQGSSGATATAPTARPPTSNASSPSTAASLPMP